MKKIKLLIGAIILTTSFSYSQNVGINTTGAAPDAGAGLDINFNNKGVLLPRVNIANLNNIAPVTGSTTTSLLVYNTNATTGQGYYYWDGARWVKFSTDNDAWQVDGNAGLNAANNFLGTTDNVAVRIRTNNTNRFEFTTNGRLRSFDFGSAGAPSYSWTADNDIGMYRPAANQLAFSTGGNEGMRIDQNTVVGIGTTTPSTSIIGGVNVQGLNVTSAATPAGSGMSEFINTSNTGTALGVSNTQAANPAAALEGTTQGAGSAIRGLHLPVGGNGVGVIGTSNSTLGIGVLGQAPGIPGANFPIEGAAVFSNGDLVFTGNAYNPSDRRLKKNIQELNESALENIINLKVYTYDMDTSIFRLNQRVNSHVGFIAQEIQEIFPDLVAEKILMEQTDKTNNYGDNSIIKTEKFLTVNHIGLIPILTKAIQEQQTKIESLEERIEALENAINE